ncbi:uncharacterized protein LOC108110548 [Drosophila eugracilis]|uniref:uncharacterized protein LOC108110548 n=1 Tax=Drosophila eugracilis TaxID=29029 RepID=UPI0007E792C0|nr:uncharacterized protein LOC108110548 [Drosophila eugracilis]
MNTNSTLLPYIMGLLSEQPHLCTTREDLIKKINDVVLEEHIAPFGSLERAVDFGLVVGVNLGIISLTNERVRLPFNFRTRQASYKVPSGPKISPCQGRRAIRQRTPTSKAAKFMGLKRSGRKSAGKTSGEVKKKQS